MKAFACALGSALLSVVVMGVVGCGADNETTAKKNMGDPGAANPNAKTGPVEKGASSYDEYAKKKQAAPNPFTKTDSYPGAKK